jgi:hypothetical protein
MNRTKGSSGSIKGAVVEAIGGVSGCRSLKAFGRRGAEVVLCFAHFFSEPRVMTPLLFESDYFRAKIMEEKLVRAARRPYTILDST